VKGFLARLALLAALSSGTGLAVVRRVPEDYPSIQAALEQLADDDSVVVEAGTYREALMAPRFSFSLLGVVDTLSMPSRPMVDPSFLEGSTHLACLVLPESIHVVIEDLIFRNGPEMYPRVPPSAVGGIENRSENLTVRRCLFDSTYDGIYNPSDSVGAVYATDCNFVNNVSMCLHAVSNRRSVAQNCTFSGSGDRLAMFSDSAVVENCSFQSAGLMAQWLWLIGAEMVVRNCEFGPTGSQIVSAVRASSSRGCLFENNMFHDVNAINSVFSFLSNEWGDTSYFLNNVFRNCRAVVAAGAGAGLELNGQGSGSWPAVVENCIFDSCTHWYASGTGYGALKCGLTTAAISNCRFTGHDARVASVQFVQSPWATMHNCRFERTEWAVYADSVENPDTVWHISAEFNWWGDSTGPYHAQLNPHGQGDEIVGPVNFVPWLTDTLLSAPESPFLLSPSSFILSVYPNPFNSKISLSLAGFSRGNLEINLCNLLGQTVDVIYRGPFSGAPLHYQSPPWLASGIYLLSARDQHSVKTRKVVLLK